MDRTYSAGVRFNNQMGTLESLSFVGEGVGASLYLGGVIFGRAQLQTIGIVFVIGAVIALLLHLGNPQRSWRAVTRIATSGVSRGTAMIGAFLGCSILAPLTQVAAAPQALASALVFVACIFAIPVTIYGGMLLRTMKAVRLWRGPFVPPSFGAQSLASASFVSAWLLADTPLRGTALTLGVMFLILAAALALAHLARAESSIGVRASLARLVSGDLRTRFFGGGAACGVVVPLLLVGGIALADPAPAVATAVLALAAVSRLLGDFAYRNSIILAGAYEPYWPSAPFRALGRRA